MLDFKSTVCLGMEGVEINLDKSYEVLGEYRSSAAEKRVKKSKT
jgi:hypothetical protein